MFYDLTSLPANVQALDRDVRRKWVNAAIGAASAGKDEGFSTEFANGIVKKEVPDFDGICRLDAKELELGEKSYQYVDSYEYEARKVSQQDADYQPAGSTKGKACSSCVFFISPARCSVVAGEIAPNGVSSLWKGAPVKVVYPDGVVPVVIVADFGASKEATLVNAPSLGQTLAGAVKQVFGGKPASPTINNKEAQQLIFYKQADGRLRWLSRYSNAFEDRDSEIMTEAAHKEYIAWADENKYYPELWVWHTVGTKIGKADCLDFLDGFAVASGLIDEGMEYVADNLASKDSKSVGVSHGFLSVQEGKYIKQYRTFEISILPQERAAVWTADFNVHGKETMMALSKDKRDFLVGALGESTVALLEASTKETADKLHAAGVEYKESQAAVGVPVAASQTAGAAAPAAPAATEPTPPVDANLANKAFGEVLVGISDNLKVLSEHVGALTKDVAEIKKGGDERIADDWASKQARAIGSAGLRASASPTNVLEGVKESEPTDPLFDMVSKNLGFSIQGAAAAAAGYPVVGAVETVTPVVR